MYFVESVASSFPWILSTIKEFIEVIIPAVFGIVMRRFFPRLPVSTEAILKTSPIA